MRNYANKPLEKLARELCAGLIRLRKGYVDAAEALARIVEPSRTYPYELVVYRLTGYRPRGTEPPVEGMEGKTLRADLLRLMLDVSDSFELRTGDYDEPVYDTRSLTERLSVSRKTIQRWRRRGLPARRLVFPDGRRRVAFLESSVNWFVGEHRRQIARSMRFSQVSDAERADIIRRAKRMAAFANCSLIEVSRRLAGRTGRSVETIRYIIRNHDRQNPGQAVFPYLSSPVSDKQREVIYRCFLRGVPVVRLAQRYNRSRGSIYRIVNEMRAKRLLHSPISYVYNPEFDLPDADERILAEPPGGGSSVQTGVPKPPPGLPEYFRQLYRVPLLTPQQERDLFRRYNYLKHKADRLRGCIDLNRVRTRQLQRIESLFLQANFVKNRIVRANLRLVVSIAKKHVGGPQSIFELISDGNVSLLRAVEKFDYARGFRFSTYASWAIMRNFARSVSKEQYVLDRFTTGHDDVVDIAAALSSYDPTEGKLSELRESIEVMLGQLSPRERTVLIDHYGLQTSGKTKTFEQLGRKLGLSKERVRQIELKALRKLRRVGRPRKANLLK
ncbi:MAG: sigma-70 family RNA polymerase sigma factor [Phycisphaerae bacterium]